MHWFKRNIGDYHKKAGRLSMLQHGAYTLLMDSCYDREQFPTMEEAIEWVWASSKDEIEAVEFVLKRFFTLDNGVYVQQRIKEEVERYQGKAETNKRIALEREAKRRKNSTKKHDSCTSGKQVDNDTPPNQEPITNNQEPRTSNQLETTVSAKANPAFDLFKYWCDVMGKNLSTSKLTAKRDKAIKARLKEGYTVEQIKQAIDDCRNDPFSMGQNDRQKPFNDIELICRTGEKLESFFSDNVQPEQQQFSQVTQKNINNTMGDW